MSLLCFIILLELPVFLLIIKALCDYQYCTAAYASLFILYISFHLSVALPDCQTCESRGHILLVFVTSLSQSLKNEEKSVKMSSLNGFTRKGLAWEPEHR